MATSDGMSKHILLVVGTGVSLPVVDEEDMEPLGAEQLFDACDCAQLLTHTTTVERTHRPPTRSASPTSFSPIMA